MPDDNSPIERILQSGEKQEPKWKQKSIVFLSEYRVPFTWLGDHDRNVPQTRLQGDERGVDQQKRERPWTLYLPQQRAQTRDFDDQPAARETQSRKPRVPLYERRHRCRAVGLEIIKLMPQDSAQAAAERPQHERADPDRIDRI